MRWMGCTGKAPAWLRKTLPGWAGVPIVLMVLLAAPLAAVQAETAAPPLRAIDSLDEAGSQPVKVRGAVTLVTASFLVIEDESGGVDVRPYGTSDHVSLGDEVEVLGSSVPGPHATVRGIVTRLWSGSAPLPVVISPDRAAEERNQLELVNVSGRLVAKKSDADGTFELTLEGEHQFFTAALPMGLTASELWPDTEALEKALSSGATLQLTGVLDALEHVGSAQGSFTLALRSSDDLVVLKGPPWWTPGHISIVFLALMFLALGAIAIHIRSLRLRFRAVTEERLRIARDIHDTMAQGFAGIALQLQAAEQVLPADASSAKEHLELALLMVRHSRRESHRSIQMLRSFASSNSLGTMLRQSAQQLGDGSSVQIEVEVEGSEPDLPYDIAMQLYRIVQEAVANAVQHAAARSIRLLLAFRKQEIALAVTDDGCGFDPAQVEHNGEHFGLAGMQERVDGLRGKLQVKSSPSGSTLLIQIPWPA